MCLSTAVWSGPIAEGLGFVDLSVPVGIAVSVVVYVVLLRSPLGRRGRPALENKEVGS